MKPHGLIGDEWLVSYAAGALSNVHALTIASHVSYQPEMQEKIRAAEAIGGDILCQEETAAISETLLAETLAKLDHHETEQEAAINKEASNTDTDIPSCLRDYLGANLDDLNWKLMGPGMHQVKLATGPEGEKLWLLRARGGTIIPEHDHRGTEMTLVLRGSYHVGSDHYTPGLIEIADADVLNHQPMIDEGEDCICLVVTEAPIKLKSFIGRMVQPFIGL
ncbi:MAG: ChrR family anti-sigma-E factor [Kordiimonas sp.]